MSTAIDNLDVAPYQSCVSCVTKGDVSTVFATHGIPEWAVAFLIKAGLTPEIAEATFMRYAEHDLGCDPGYVPGGRVKVIFRLCPECAEQAGISVADINSDQIPCYPQPRD